MLINVFWFVGLVSCPEDEIRIFVEFTELEVSLRLIF